MASIESIKAAIIDELSNRSELSATDLANYERQFIDNLHMRKVNGLLTTDIADYEQHELYAYAEELSDEEWLVVIRQRGYGQSSTIVR